MTATPEPDSHRRRRATTTAAVWIPGLAVAVGAAVATAHGLFEVALAARVPAAIAWIYPLITDGLALVAYAASARLHSSGARYAWSVVIVAAGLSGIAQASYLASDTAIDDGGTLAISPALRFGVGAWPAIAAAVVAHLLYLLATADRTSVADDVPAPGALTDHRSTPDRSTAGVQPRLNGDRSIRPAMNAGPSVDAAAEQPEDEPARGQSAPVDAPAEPAEAPARERARDAALRHIRCHGDWPTVTEVETASAVSRGTAAAALKALRDQTNPLHLVTGDNDTEA